MRNTVLAISFITLILCACSRKKETLMAQVEKDQNNKYIDDIKFVNDAHNAVMMNVFLGRLAERNASSEIVKQLATSISNDSHLSHVELKRIALYRKMQFNDDLCAARQQQYDAFSKVTGKAFDNAYMKYILKDHRASLVIFEEEAIYGRIADLRTWAESEAGITRHRLGAAQMAMDNFEAAK